MKSLIQRLKTPAVVLSLALLAGRGMGFVREMALAHSLGVSAQADWAVVYFVIPDLLVNLLLAGGLSAVLVPRFAQLQTLQASGRALIQSAGCVGLLFTAIALGLGWAPEALLQWIAPGLALADKPWAATDLWWVALAVPLTALSGVFTAYLNGHQRYLVAGLGTFIFNAAVVVALGVGLGWARSDQWAVLHAMALGVFFGAALRLASQVWDTLAQRKRHTWLNVNKAHMHDNQAQGLDGVLWPFTQALLATSMGLWVPVYARALMSLSGEGAVAGFNYATKLAELPSGIAVTSIASVLLAPMAHHALDRNLHAVRRLFVQGLRRAVLVAVACALVMGLCMEPILNALFGLHKMPELQGMQLLSWGRWTIWILPSVAFSSMGAAVLNALGRQKDYLYATACACAAGAVLLHIGLNLGQGSGIMQALVAFQLIWGLVLAGLAHVRLAKEKA